MAGDDYPLKSVVKAWTTKIERAMKFKRAEFGRHAAEAMRFFDGDQGFIWESEYQTGPGGYIAPGSAADPPAFRMTVMRVTELVQLMAPKLYPSNPYRSIAPRNYPTLDPMMFGNPNDPFVAGFIAQMQQQEQFRQGMVGQASMLLEAALNYTPNELGLKDHSRRVIDECLIKGMGVWWTEVFQPHRNAHKLIGSFQDSADNIVFDPDAETFEDITWIARRRFHPLWEVESRFGLEPGTLFGRGTHETINNQAESESTRDGKFKRKTGRDTRDLLEYWEIYSKQGFGDRAWGVQQQVANDVAMFGDFCYLAVSKTVPYPLNMPNSLLINGSEDEIFDAAQWPIPFWADGKWPCTILKFHGNPNSIYPLSHIKPAIGELRFLSWAMSFLATKIRSACNTLVGIPKSAAESLRESLFRSENGYTIIELEAAAGTDLKSLVSIFDAPGFHEDIWKIIQAVNEQVDKRLGLTELLYGQTATQSRSSADAQAKQQNSSIRVDDMFTCTRGALTELARNEAFAARWCYTQQDLIPIIGPQGAAFWTQHMVPDNLETLAREFDYRIEAGNAREPTKEVRVEQMNQSVQVWGPLLQNYAAATGNWNPINALLRDWGQANDINTAPYMLPPPPPPMPMPQQGQHPGQQPPGQQKKPPQPNPGLSQAHMPPRRR